MLQGREWRIQYEDLYDLCFICEKYGHKEMVCPKKTVQFDGTSREEEARPTAAVNTMAKNGNAKSASFGPWTVVQRGGQQSSRPAKGRMGSRRLSKLTLISVVIVGRREDRLGLQLARRGRVQGQLVRRLTDLAHGLMR